MGWAIRLTMRLLHVIFALALIQPIAGLAQNPLAPPAPKPLFTRQNSFGVPFVMDPAEPGARKAAEVQLHVSENGGPWRPYAKAAPTNSSILFRATRDGEYRFLVRTKDDHGELQPTGPPHAELIVILDTDPPVLELVVERGSGGEVHAHWRVRDPHLRPDSLRLEYQVGPDGPWVPVAVDLPVVGATTSARDATWVPEARSVPITIRAEVSDFAGNVTKTQRSLSPVAPKVNPPGTPAEDNVAHWPGERTQDMPLAGSDPPGMPGVFPGRTGNEQAIAAAARRYGAVTEQIGPGVLPSVEEVLPPPHEEIVSAGPATERALPIPMQPEEVGLPPTMNEARQASPRTRRDLQQVDGPRLPGPTMVPTSIDAIPGAQPTSSKAGGAIEEKLPPGIQPRMFNTRRIELDYEIEASDATAPQRIDIWGTKDGGRTWSKVGDDDDNRGPAIVTVDQDGLYGFRIVVAGQAGAGEDVPKPGDAPDVWIGVDTVKPVGQIVSVEPGTGEQKNGIMIRFEASDSTLAARPISLYYSATASGPWNPVGMDLPNSGSFEWLPEPNAPASAFLRLEVRDLAGNVCVVDTPQPYSLQPSRPRIRIRDARPAGNEPAANDPAAAAPPVWQEFRR